MMPYDLEDNIVPGHGELMGDSDIHTQSNMGLFPGDIRHKT